MGARKINLMMHLMAMRIVKGETRERSRRGKKRGRKGREEGKGEERV